ncbi:hypothetical protein DV736_g4741, partial [Chaetothyriales sp. CBS 134916]
MTGNATLSEQSRMANTGSAQLQSTSDDNNGADLSFEIQHDSQETEGVTTVPSSTKRTPSVSSTASETSVSARKTGSTTPEAPTKRTCVDMLNPLKRRSLPPVPLNREVSREYRAGFFSRLYFQWVAPLLSVGYQRPLELNDIWTVNPDRGIAVLSVELNNALKKRKANLGKLDPLAMAMYDTFKTEFLIGGACQLIAACIQVLTPFTLKYLIAFAQEAYNAKFNGGVSPPVARGVGLVIGIACMQMVQSLCTNHTLYRGMMVGGQARATLIACVFEKAVKLSGRAKVGHIDSNLLNNAEHSGEDRGPNTGEGWSNGRINNLMSTDTSRIDLASAMFHRCWTSPIQVLLALALLCVNLGYSALAGFVFICLMMPILGRAIRSLAARRREINKITDQRLQLTQEVVSSVRFIKLFAWESTFLSRLAKIRKQEIHKIFILLSIRNGILAVAVVTPILASMLTFVTYALTKHVLNAAPVFSSLALFNVLAVPLEFLPTALGRVIDAHASVERISRFLDAEEIPDETLWNIGGKDAITIDNASFTWEQNALQHTQDAVTEPRKDGRQTKDDTPSCASGNLSDEAQQQPFQLSDVNLSFARNELVAVIGSVGSGKSSLLSALAGDMRKTGGTVIFGASRAFCPQYAWIQNATFKQNIVFGREFNENWYSAVVDACALRPDVDMLPSGDLTEIGERGITISGGQKQRLNIARSIYFDADIVIMDDPLSAVDAHVGRHIMDNAICGLLRNKCRILATHQLHVLHRTDRIIWMKAGAVYKVATFPELMDQDAEFRKLMETTSSEERSQQQPQTNAEQNEDEKVSLRKMKSARIADPLMQQEDQIVRGAHWDVYRDYIKASGSLWNLLLVLSVVVLSQGANIITNLWLSWWTSDKFHFPTRIYVCVYIALGGLQSLLLFAFAATFTSLGARASKAMLHQAVSRALGAPLFFFDTTPIGRIMNRFSKDVDTLDNTLSDNVRFLFYLVAMITTVFCLTFAYYPYFAIALVPLIVAMVFAAGYYRASAREIKRYEAVLRSVVFARFGEALTGTATIRAYGVQKQFTSSLIEAMDSMDGAYFLTFANQRWLSIRLDTVGNLLIFVVGILIITSRFSVDPSIGGLVMSYMLTIVLMLQMTVRQFAEVENDMNSMERLHYYGKHLEQEAPPHMGEVRASWPEQGEIIFSNVQMRYRPGLPLVLNSLSLHVRPGERVGIVGRTGAGKSSIVSALFRLVELSGGSITIDKVNIATIGLHDLRSRLAILPQDPTLFRGTIRTNLDPLNEHEDLQLWDAMRQAGLIGEPQLLQQQSAEGGRSLHLDTPVEDEGLNFSLGQRQLLALARALVRNAQIIICDEATSSVDFETDGKIQQTIFKAFKGRTLLCIAHRLKTILRYGWFPEGQIRFALPLTFLPKYYSHHPSLFLTADSLSVPYLLYRYDRILVMDSGKAVELDTPIRLYNNPGGIFRGMCDRSGIKREDFNGSGEYEDGW